MIDNFLRFGDIKPDGTILRDVKICAITGKPIEPGDMMVTFPGTGKFVRIKAPLNWPQNADKFEDSRKELETIAKAMSEIASAKGTGEAPVKDKK